MNEAEQDALDRQRESAAAEKNDPGFLQKLVQALRKKPQPPMEVSPNEDPRTLYPYYRSPVKGKDYIDSKPDPDTIRNYY